MSTATYHVGDVLDLAPILEHGSIDLILTSPPFLGLRSYLPNEHPLKAREGGTQPTPGSYIDWLLTVIEELSPSLAPHGSLVIELGDTYAGSGGSGGDYSEGGWRAGQARWQGSAKIGRTTNVRDGRRSDGAWKGERPGWPRAKSVSLIPELLRLSLVYGHNPLTGRSTPPWILRNTITWCRPNPTPSALGDKVRPATSDVMCFTRSSSRWFDLDAERTTNLRADEYRPRATLNRGAPGYHVDGDINNSGQNPAGSPLLDWWELPPGGYDGAHYAVWPKELVRRLISLMCPLRVCRVCGEPSRRIVDVPHTDWYPTARSTAQTKHVSDQGFIGRRMDKHVETLGWTDCGHDDWRDGMVLDPFAGSGTTLEVATGMGRDSIGIDLDGRNLTLARQRIGMFLEEPV